MYTGCMPTRNAIKVYAPKSYYHLYTRGVNKQTIFENDDDKLFFLGLLKRYLSKNRPTRVGHTPYASYADTLDLLAYCLMDNHIHLLFYQHDEPRAIAEFMRRVMTTYSMYFNKKHGRVGPLFQSRYLASRIDNDAYLHHISRYIHRNPKHWRKFPHSSLRYYMGKAQADWVKPAPILELFDNNAGRYLKFVADMDADDEENIPEFLAHE